MPKCVTCGSDFQNAVLIGGKRRNLQRRHNCLSCVPFGDQRNGRMVDGVRVKRGQKITCACGRVYEYDYKKGHSRTKCNSCLVNSRRPERKLQAISYKGGCCQICAYSRCVRAMVFHHVDPEQKDFEPGAMMNMSWESVRRELDKCVLICANCHAEVHDGLVVPPTSSTSVVRSPDKREAEGSTPSSWTTARS